MSLLSVTPAMAFTIVCCICAFQESKLTAKYKWFHAYGRIKAFFALDFLVAGIMGIGSCIISPRSNLLGLHPLSAFLISFGFLLISAGMYISSYQKCPDIVKKGCIPSMLISGAGVCLKVALFFLIFIWKLETPKQVVTADGQQYWVPRNGSSKAYDSHGTCVGTVSDDGGSLLLFHQD